jgi:hypothetical protein
MRNFMLPKEAIKEFKKLYLKNYGIQLSDEEATHRANNLVALYTAVYGDNSGLLWRQNQDDIN